MGFFDWLFGKSKKQLEREEKQLSEQWAQFQKREQENKQEFEKQRRAEAKLKREREEQREKQRAIEALEEKARKQREVEQRAKKEAETQREREKEQHRQAKLRATERAPAELEENERIRQQFLQLNFSSKRKDNHEDFARILRENHISTLYHFTDRANISSIKEHGALLSWWYCEQNGITIAKPGSDDTSKSLDRRYSLQDYVRLSFTPNHPMMYVAKNQGRIQNPIVLKINPEICLFEETKFSDMNATKTGHKCGQTLDDLIRIKFAVVKQNTHFDLSDEDKPYYQAEVLVKTRLPIEWITNINAF